jgi:hypothetical protein
LAIVSTEPTKLRWILPTVKNNIFYAAIFALSTVGSSVNGVQLFFTVIDAPERVS